ncbi:PcfJ domain-containing protein [Agrobacterium salinitolerans]|nr:PcfJ domain-containing protein [Agrobacterium salinitolerans]
MTAEAPAIRVMRMFIESSSQGNPELHRLLEISLLRIARKATKRPSASLSPFFELDHVVDWLKAALVNGAPWLRNLDAHGRPKKLMKFGSLDAMKREADRDMLRWSQKVLRRDLPENSEEIVATLEQGYTMVRLLSVEALDAETTEMQHCVGQGAYDEALTDGKTVLLSLRDEHGKAHATIEVCDGLVEQVQGKQNKPPKAKYIPLIAAYFRQTDYNWSLFGDGSEGFVIDVHGTIHSNDDLPDELHAHGALVLREVARMPSLVTATTDITVHCIANEETPLRLEAGRNISLIGPGFTTCPELVLTGDLSLDHTKITALPKGLSVGSLHVRSTPLATLPGDLRCGGSISLKFTEVTALPSGLWKVEDSKVSSFGTVDLLGSPISDLGGLNHVNGSLRIAGTKMNAIPDGFFVSKDLDIGELDLIVVGEGVSANRLTAAVTKSIFFLGDVLQLGDIHLVNCGVSFPSVVKCSQSVTMIRCRVGLMPERIECAGKLDLASSSSNSLPGFIRAKQLWLADMCNWWSDPLSALEGDIEAEVIAIQDRHIGLGNGVKADTVAIFPAVHRYVEMQVSDARQYLALPGERSSDAIDKFGRGHSVELAYDLFHGVLPGSIEDKIGKTDSLYGFGSAR